MVDPMLLQNRIHYKYTPQWNLLYNSISAAKVCSLHITTKQFATLYLTDFQFGITWYKEVECIKFDKV